MKFLSKNLANPGGRALLALDTGLGKSAVVPGPLLKVMFMENILYSYPYSSPYYSYYPYCYDDDDHGQLPA